MINQYWTLTHTSFFLSKTPVQIDSSLELLALSYVGYSLMLFVEADLDYVIV